MPRFDLVISDCDGVLVDSERLAVRAELSDERQVQIAEIPAGVSTFDELA